MSPKDESTLPLILERHFGKKKAKGLMTVTQAAEESGYSRSTLKRWRYKGGPQPSEELRIGGLFVPLYTKADIKKLKAYGAGMKPGPKPGARRNGS